MHSLRSLVWLVAFVARTCAPGRVPEQHKHATHPEIPSEIAVRVAAMCDPKVLELRAPNGIGRVLGHAWSGDGRRAVVWSWVTATVVDSATGAEQARFSSPEGRLIARVVLSHNGRYAVVSSEPIGTKSSVESADAFDVETGRRIELQLPSSAEQNTLWQLLPQSSSIAVVRVEPRASSARLSVVDLDANKESASIGLPGDWHDDKPADRYLSVSPDGTVIAVGHGRRIAFVRLASGAVQDFARLPESTHVVFSSDSRNAAWIEVRGIGLWSADQTKRRLLNDPRCTPDSVPYPGLDVGLFDSSGERLASPGAGCSCVWDTETARVVAVLAALNQSEQPGEFPLTPSAWVSGGAGLITSDGVLWSLAPQRRVVADIWGWSPPADPKLVLHASQLPGSYQISKLDGGLRMSSKGRVNCELEEARNLVGVDETAFVGCRPGPVFVTSPGADARHFGAGDWTEMSADPERKALTLVTSFGLGLYDPASASLKTTLVSDVGHGRGRFDHLVVSRFYGTTLELASSASAPDQRVMRWRINLDEGRLRISHQLEAPSACDHRDPNLANDLNHTWSHSRDRSLALCEAVTGRVVARLAGDGTKKTLTIGKDAQVIAVDSLAGSTLWLPQHNQMIPLQGSDRMQWHFGSSKILAGEASAMRINVYEVPSARRIATWPIDDHYSHLLAIDEDNDWALIGGSSVLQLRRLRDGERLAHVGFGEPVAAGFGPSSIVVVSDGQKLWFFRAPKLEPLGELLIDGERALFVDTHGAFETSSPEAWRQELGCRRGLDELRFDSCRNAFYREGLLRATLLAPADRAPVARSATPIRRQHRVFGAASEKPTH